MIWLEIYVVVLALLLALLLGTGKAQRDLVLQALAWPIVIPVGLVVRWWGKRQPEPPPLEVTITADTRAFEEAMRSTTEAFDHYQASMVEASRKRREIEGRPPL